MLGVKEAPGPSQDITQNLKNLQKIIDGSNQSTTIDPESVAAPGAKAQGPGSRSLLTKLTISDLPFGFDQIELSIS